MPEWLKVFLMAINTIAGALGCLGIISIAVKHPFKMLENTIKKTINETVGSKIDLLIREQGNHNKYVILNFERDIREGRKKTDEQFGYIIKAIEQYFNSGQNGKIKIAADYILEQYKKQKE